MKYLSIEEAGQIAEASEIIASAVTPVIVKAIAAATPGTAMVGDLLVAEPARDYRKELWVGALLAAMHLNYDTPRSAPEVADQALAEFDKRFPSENQNG